MRISKSRFVTYKGSAQLETFKNLIVFFRNLRYKNPHSQGFRLQ